MNPPNRLLRTGAAAAGGFLTVGRPLAGAVRAQFNMSRRDVGDLLHAVTNPSLTLAFMAVFAYVGRKDLAAYSLVAPLLMSVGAMAVYVASELMTREREFQTLELSVVCPAPFPMVLFARIAVITAISLIGFVESWLIIRFVFGVTVAVHHPWLFAATMLLTAFAAAGTALIAGAVFCFAQAARTFQNSIAYPVFLLSGILVPISVFPDWLEPLSRLIFLYWSANLLRHSTQPAAPEGVLLGLGAIAVLGVGAALVGGMLMVRMLDHLRREGRLGLA